MKSSRLAKSLEILICLVMFFTVVTACQTSDPPSGSSGATSTKSTETKASTDVDGTTETENSNETENDRYGKFDPSIWLAHDLAQFFHSSIEYLFLFKEEDRK